MLKRAFLFTLVILLCIQVFAQYTTNGVYKLNGTPQKKYALYFPSSYVKGKSMPVVLAFHPLNSLRWDASSWRDELKDFAEANEVILICPDGGKDGRFDDLGDLDFSKRLVREMLIRYNIHPNCIHAMGYGQGANAALKMVARHMNFINGLLLIGTNANVLNLDTKAMSNSFNLPCYLIHGRNDNLKYKFYPLKKALNESGACVNTKLIKGIGHSIDFPNRLSLISEGIQWLMNVNCSKPEYVWEENQSLVRSRVEDKPEISISGLEVRLSNLSPSQAIQRIQVYNDMGILIRVIRQPKQVASILLPNEGKYRISLQSAFKTDHVNIQINSL